MIQRFGKSLERAFRKLRPHLVPAYRQAFKSLVARGLLERREGERIVCCDFSNSAIDAVGGALLLQLGARPHRRWIFSRIHRPPRDAFLVWNPLFEVIVTHRAYGRSPVL